MKLTRFLFILGVALDCQAQDSLGTFEAPVNAEIVELQSLRTVTELGTFEVVREAPALIVAEIVEASGGPAVLPVTIPEKPPPALVVEIIQPRGPTAEQLQLMQEYHLSVPPTMQGGNIKQERDDGITPEQRQLMREYNLSVPPVMRSSGHSTAPPYAPSPQYREQVVCQTR